MATSIEFRNVSKSYRRLELLKELDLSIEAGTFAVVFGTPGCGKSVILRLLTGLEKPNSGEIYLRGENAQHISPGERNIGYIPQSFALYPHFSVYNNIAYPLNLAGVPKNEIDKIVNQTADMLGITKLLKKTPNQLSGGEKQRVAIARGIAKKTDIYVFDDPLTGLDFKLREQLFDDLKNMQDMLKATFLYTTSDALEALMLAQHISILYGGKCVESGELLPVYTSPSHSKSMELLGFPKTNMISGQVSTVDGKMFCETALFTFPVKLTQPVDGLVTVGIRPQDILLDCAVDASVTNQAKILLKEDLGGELVVHLSVNGNPVLAVIRHEDDRGLRDENTMIGLNPPSALVFDAQTGRRIGQGSHT